MVVHVGPWVSMSSGVTTGLFAAFLVWPVLAPSAMAAMPVGDGAAVPVSAAASRSTGRTASAGLPASANRSPRAVPPVVAGAASGVGRVASARPIAKPVRLVDINSASTADLLKLPGVGPVEVERIVAGRPYRTSADLATKNVLPTGAYLALRRSIVAMPPRGGEGSERARPGPGVVKAAGSASAAARGGVP